MPRSSEKASFVLTEHIFVRLTFNFRHNITKHYKGKIFDCHCGSIFKLNHQLKIHQQIHDEKQTCEVCKKKFSNTLSLGSHWRKNHLETHGRLESTKSKFFYRDLVTSDYQISNLAASRVLNSSGIFICDKCGLKYPNRDSFRIHHWLYHRNFSVFCDLCPRSFTRKQRLADHMKQVHVRFRPFECNVCSYKTSCIRSLKIHMLRHGAKTECEICHKLVSNIENHIGTHVKVECSICGKTYSKNHLSRHKKTHRNRK